jgi:hypothetical protein
MQLQRPAREGTCALQLKSEQSRQEIRGKQVARARALTSRVPPVSTTYSCVVCTYRDCSNADGAHGRQVQELASGWVRPMLVRKSTAKFI